MKNAKITPQKVGPSQTVIGMFKNQTTKVSHGLKRKSLSHDEQDDTGDNSDDDFQIIKIEAKSKYFKTRHHVTSNKSRHELKPKSSSSTTNCSKMGSEGRLHVLPNIVNHRIPSSLPNEHISQSSQKENEIKGEPKASRITEVIEVDSDESEAEVIGLHQNLPTNHDRQNKHIDMPLSPSKKLSLLKTRSSRRIANNMLLIARENSEQNLEFAKSSKNRSAGDSDSDSETCEPVYYDGDFTPAKKQKLKLKFSKIGSLPNTKLKHRAMPQQNKQSVSSREISELKAKHVSRLSRENSKLLWCQLFQKKNTEDVSVTEVECGKPSNRGTDVKEGEGTGLRRSREEIPGDELGPKMVIPGGPQEEIGLNEGCEAGLDVKHEGPAEDANSGLEVPLKDANSGLEVLLKDANSGLEVPLKDANSDLAEDDEGTHLIPYYLENFRTILSAVLGDEDNCKLFEEEDDKWIDIFNHISESGQKLYVRLFSRKLAWLPAGKISYPRIGADLASVLQELVDHNLVMTESRLVDLEQTLKVMSAGDLKVLAKSFHINSTGLAKPQLCAALIAKSRQSTVCSLFGGRGNRSEVAMLTRAKKLLGKAFRLQDSPRRVFVRILMLFSVVHSWLDEDQANGGTPQLYQMLLVNMGRVVFPEFTVNKQTKLIKDREGLLRFERAMLYENDLSTCVEKGDWTGAYDVYLQADQEFRKHMEDADLISFDTALPSYLRSCTAGSVLTKVLSEGVDVLQRRKDYVAAIALLRRLLGQDVYCANYRGYWWERLALDLEVHLKKPVEALEAIGNGLAESSVNVGHRLALYLRAEKLCTSSNSKFKHRMKEFTHEEVIDAPKHILEGRVLPHSIPGLRFSFLLDSPAQRRDSEDVTVCAVEELVLDHYKHNGYPHGLHAEGSIISNLFNLFFWDVLFMDVPDAFHSPYQTQPLDFHSRHFYTNRRDAIDARLAKIETADDQALCEMVAETWNKHFDVRCSGLSWERFKNLEHAQGLVTCIAGNRLSGMLRRYVTNPRHTRSGFPDLTLWNTDTKAFKICEVKGPGDKLSHKQMLWLDHLLRLGVDAEVCQVKAVGAKRLRPAASTTTS